MTNYDDMKLAIEAMTGGTNTVILDDTGMPSVMVVLPKMYKNVLVSGAPEEIHSGFIYNNAVKEKVAISKFLNIVYNNRAYSLPMKDPRASVNFDTANNYCRNKGNGWTVTPFALWSAIALWCKKNGTMPHGNNNYGRDVTNIWERGVQTSSETPSGGAERTCRTATGSGPASWYHNHDYSGIADMNGNVWDWCAGFRILDGEVQIIPNANCADKTVDLSASSGEWRAIDADGNLVAAGSSGTVKMDFVGNKLVYTTGNKSYQGTDNKGNTFTANAFDDTVNDGAKLLLRELAILPELNDTDYGSDYFYYNLSGERLPVRGGGWSRGAGAGVFGSYLSGARSGSTGHIGFRSAFYGDF